MGLMLSAIQRKGLWSRGSRGALGKARALLQTCGPSSIMPPISSTTPPCSIHICKLEPRARVHLRMQMESALRFGLTWEELDLQDRRDGSPHPILLPCRVVGGSSPKVYSFLCTPILLWVKMWGCANVLWIHEYVRVYVVSVNTHGYVLCESTR